jgi:putative hemolysin
MVADEFGGIVGMATLVDVLEAIAGDFPSQEERLRPHAVAREDGTWLVDGLMELGELEAVLPVLRFPKEPSRGFDTLAGFVVSKLGRVPREGEVLEWLGHRFEVIDMDRHRVDKVLVTRLAVSEHNEDPAREE